MYKIYLVNQDWNINSGLLLAELDTEEKAYDYIIEESKRRVKRLYYVITNVIDKDTKVYDYGSYTKFLLSKNDCR